MLMLMLMLMPMPSMHPHQTTKNQDFRPVSKGHKDATLFTNGLQSSIIVHCGIVTKPSFQLLTPVPSSTLFSWSGGNKRIHLFDLTLHLHLHCILHLYLTLPMCLWFLGRDTQLQAKRYL
jgi:hypothetical protein